MPISIGSVALLATHLQAGTLRPLAQTGAQRASTLSSLPTVAESGFPGFEAEAWWGVFAPGKSAPTIAFLGTHAAETDCADACVALRPAR